MYRPRFNGILLADNGEITCDGSANVSTVTYPRTKGILVKENGVKQATITLHCSQQRKSTLDNQEKLQHALFENLASVGIGTLTIEGVTITDCVFKTVNFKEVKNNYMNYDVVFEWGPQNTYSAIDTITYTKKSPYPELSRQRIGTFTPIGKGAFTFGHEVEQLKSCEWALERNLVEAWAYEYEHQVWGGKETIAVNGWIAGASVQSRILNFAYNAIVGPLGLVGTLTVGGNTTTYAVFSSFSIQPPKRGNVYWTANFITSIKC
jgi:hypothetical protein